MRAARDYALKPERYHPGSGGDAAAFRPGVAPPVCAQRTDLVLPQRGEEPLLLGQPPEPDDGLQWHYLYLELGCRPDLEPEPVQQAPAARDQRDGSRRDPAPCGGVSALG